MRRKISVESVLCSLALLASTIAWTVHASSPAHAAQVYTYKVVLLASNEPPLEEQLNRASKDGWEFVTIDTITDLNLRGTRYLVLRR